MAGWREKNFMSRKNHAIRKFYWKVFRFIPSVYLLLKTYYLLLFVLGSSATIKLLLRRTLHRLVILLKSSRFILHCQQLKWRTLKT